LPQRYVRPQPFEELDHTADAGLVVRGRTADETLARLVLAYAEMVSGGAEVIAQDEELVEVEPGDHLSMAIDVLRELLYRFETRKCIPASCEVLRFAPEHGATVKLEMGPYDERVHAEGLAFKAVTLHAARFEPEGNNWIAQVVFDV